MVGIVPLLYVGYKVLRRSTYYKPDEVDLLKDLDEIEEYEANYQPQPAKCDFRLIINFTYSNEPYRNAFEKSLDFLFG